MNCKELKRKSVKTKKSSHKLCADFNSSSSVVPVIKIENSEKNENIDDLSVLVKESSINFMGFDLKEIESLDKRFRMLDMHSNGTISLDDFQTLAELQRNPLVTRIIDIFDSDKRGYIVFQEFVKEMSLFSYHNNQGEELLKFAFKIYDMNNDGFISNGELFQVLKLLVSNRLKDTELQQIVDKTMLYADKDQDGRISFDEFAAAAGGIGYNQKMVWMNT